MEIKKYAKVGLFVLLINLAIADDTGHGVDGPNAVPENPDETVADSTIRFWNVVLETFTFSTEE